MFRLNLFLATLLCTCVCVSFANPLLEVFYIEDETYVKIYKQSHLRLCAWMPDPPVPPSPVPVLNRAITFFTGEEYKGDWVSFKVHYNSLAEGRSPPDRGKVNDITIVESDGIRNQPWTHYFFPRDEVQNGQLPQDKHRCIEVRVDKTGTYYSPTHSEKGGGPMYYYPILIFSKTQYWELHHIDKLEGDTWTRVWAVGQGYIGPATS